MFAMATEEPSFNVMEPLLNLAFGSSKFGEFEFVTHDMYHPSYPVAGRPKGQIRVTKITGDAGDRFGLTSRFNFNILNCTSFAARAREHTVWGQMTYTQKTRTEKP